MKPPYRIVVTTCDKYLEALRAFSFLLNKYWMPVPPDVVVLGFKPPDFKLPDNFEFVSVGKFSDYPVDRWSDQLKVGLEMIPDEVFIFMLEDMWIIRQVYTDVVDMAYDYMIQFQYTARLDLTGDRWNAFDSQGRRPQFYGKLGPYDLVISSIYSQYHMSTMPAFWRKRHLQRVLIPGETPWQVELQGTPRLAAMEDVIVIGTNAWPIRNTLAFRGGNVGSLLLDEVHPDDVKMLKAHGLLKGFGYE